MSASQQIPPEKISYFGLRALKKFPELIPLVSILGFACAMAGAYVGYSLYQKADVTVIKSKGSPPWERVNPEQSQKLLNFNCDYKKIPELESLKAEIGSYKF